MWQGVWPDAGNVRIYYSNDLQKYDLVVFNFVDAVNVSFNQLAILDKNASSINPNNSSVVAAYSKKILWDFPQAQSIKMSRFAMLGSVWAPHADVYALGGSINGQLISDSFTTEGGMELHAILVPPSIDEIDEDEKDPIFGLLEITKMDADQWYLNVVLQGAVFSLLYKNTIRKRDSMKLMAVVIPRIKMVRF